MIRRRFRTSIHMSLMRPEIIFLVLFCGACSDVCDAWDTKCMDNSIYICRGSSAERSTAWRLFRDCENFHATCKEGIQTKYFDFETSSYHIVDVEFTDVSCVTSDFDCVDSEGYFCTPENEIVVNCIVPEGETEIVAAVSVDNWGERPLCVTTVYGTGFAYGEGPCDEGAYMCDDVGRTLKCEEDTWQLASDFCNL